MRVEAVKKHIADKLSKGLDKRLTYHHIGHTLSVFEAARSFAKAEGLTAEEAELLEVAALFHDSGFLKQREGHEEISCEIARKDLPSFNFSKQQLDQVCSYIMATEVGRIPVTIYDKIMKDADLDYLGTDAYFDVSEKLFIELKNFELIKSSGSDWLDMQIQFLSKHRYHTRTAMLLREEKKQKILHLLIQKKHV